MFCNQPEAILAFRVSNFVVAFRVLVRAVDFGAYLVFLTQLVFRFLKDLY